MILECWVDVLLTEVQLIYNVLISLYSKVFQLHVYTLLYCIVEPCCLPNSHSNPSHPLAHHMSVLCDCESEFFCSIDKFTGVIFQIPHVSDIIWYLSFSFLFSIMIFSSIYVAAIGIDSFFLWLNSIPLCVCVCVCVHIDTTFSLSTHLSVDIYVTATSWLLLIVLL